MSETLVIAENVGKKFCRDLKRSLWYAVKDSATELFNGDTSGLSRLRPTEFWANSSISFELNRGQCLGLVGHNGAGKTTLLKQLLGLIKPDVGEIRIRGRVGGLIALGAGFDPVLTGRENVLINGSLLGLSTGQVRDKLDEIIEFAELSDAIDAPVRTYSSGMKVRLGFSVAALMVKPDILLVDEVLAVGDAAFRVKSMNVIGSLMSNASVVFVSHNEALVRKICTSAILLQRGKMLACGGVGQVFDEYNELGGVLAQKERPVHRSDDVGSVAIEVHNNVAFDEPLCIKISADLHRDVGPCYVRVVIYAKTSEMIAEYNGKIRGELYDLKKGKFEESDLQVPHRLRPGRYDVSVLMHYDGQAKFLFYADKNFELCVTGDIASHAPIVL